MSRLRGKLPHPSFLDRLPTEALCNIFLQLRREFFPDTTTDWITVIHVCRRWRNVALSYALLWTNIDGTMRESVRDFFLLNAREAPLTVKEMNIYSDDDEDNEQILLRQLYHIAELHINFHPSSQRHAEYWMAKLVSPTDAPMLRCLVLEMDSSNYGSSPVIVTVDETPIRITSLSLTDVRIRFPPNRAQTDVKHFSFTSPQTDYRQPTLAETRAMIRMIELMPNLVSLSISDHNFLPHDDLALPISLPHLQTLSFDGRFSGYMFFYNYLNVAPNTQVKLHLRVTDSDSVRDSFFYGQIGTHLKRRRETESDDQTCKVTIDNRVWFVHGDSPLFQSVRINEIPHGLMAATSPSTPIDSSLEFKFDTFVHPDGRYTLQHLHNMTKDLSRTCVEHLEVTCNVVYANPECVQPDEPSFLRWNGLRTLVLGDIWLSDWLVPHLERRQGELFVFVKGELFNTDSCSTHAHSLIGSDFTVFPRLENLEIRNIRPDWYRVLMDLDDMARIIKRFFTHLRVVLEARGRSDKYQMKSLAIYESCIPKEWMVSETTAIWCNSSMAWDGESWDDYWATPFED